LINPLEKLRITTFPVLIKRLNMRSPLYWLLKVYAFSLAGLLAVAVISQLFNLVTGVPIQTSWEQLPVDIGVALALPIFMPVVTSFISPLGIVGLLGLLVVGVARATKQPRKIFLNNGFGLPEWLLVAGLLGTVGFSLFWLTRAGDYTTAYLAGTGYWIVNLIFVWWMTRRQLSGQALP
jgi:hypothetical protein